MTHCNPLSGLRKNGSIGIPLPDTEARVAPLDDPSASVAPGTHGELLIRGPQVMRGYWQRPEETQEVLTDGWLRTGDIAVMDADGFFFIVAGRRT